MPFIHVKTNAAVADEKETAIKSALGQAITATPGKSENWLMVCIEPEQILYFQGNSDPAAMVEVSVYGQANPSAFNTLTAKICAILHEQLSIEPSRIYVKYTATTDWGWNGSNF